MYKRQLRRLLGYDLGVAITGQEDLGVTIVVTEGFGRIAMAKRTDHPLKTVLLLVILAGIAWAGYEFIHVRKILTPKAQAFVPKEVLDEVRESVLDAYADNVCFSEIGPVHYRPKERHYRVEFTVEDVCLHDARQMCEDIAYLVHDHVHKSVGVFAYNAAGNPVAKFLK